MSSTTPDDATEVGSYFVSNYPPFSFWNKDHLPAAQDALQAAPQEGSPIGLYLHIPFCRKRCKFCYFRVYTDKNSKEIERTKATCPMCRAETVLVKQERFKGTSLIP